MHLEEALHKGENFSRKQLMVPGIKLFLHQLSYNSYLLNSLKN